MSTPIVTINPVTASPPAGSSTGSSNNNLEFDPKYSSTLPFDATKQPTEAFSPSHAGSDAVSQELLILDQLRQHPENTTDAQLFLLYTSGLVQNDMIYQPLIMPNKDVTTLDDLISSITVIQEGGTSKSLIAYAIDIAIEEKFAAEKTTNPNWDPTVSYGGQPSFCDSLRALFPGESKVSKEANDEIDFWENGHWDSYYSENSKKSSDEIRQTASTDWATAIAHSNISSVETELRVDAVNSAGASGNIMQSLMYLYQLLDMLGYLDLSGLTGQINWYNDRTNDLNVISGEWSEGFASNDAADTFMENIQNFVYEVNNAPDGYADQNLIDTVNKSLGEDGGFLSTPTGYWYKGSDGKYYNADIEYMYENPNTQYLTYLDLGDRSGYYTAPDMDNPAYYYYYDGNSSPALYDVNGNRLTYEDCYNNQDLPLYTYTNGKYVPFTVSGQQQTAVNVFPAYSNAVSPNNTKGNSQIKKNNDYPPEINFYTTLESWELDPTGKTPPPPEYGAVQQDINTDNTAFTNMANTTSTEISQMASWIQAVESAMEQTIEAYIDTVQASVQNQIV